MPDPQIIATYYTEATYCETKEIPRLHGPPPKCQKGSSNVFNGVSCFSKICITFPLVLGGTGVGVGTLEIWLKES